MNTTITREEAQERANAGLGAYVVWASNVPSYFETELGAIEFANTLSWHEWSQEGGQPVARVLANAAPLSKCAARKARRRGWPSPVTFPA
jgi:hypothetical protein